MRSEATAKELKEVLEGRKFDKYITWAERHIFISKFLMETELVDIREVVTACRDPKDDKFLEVAVNGKANFIITGDNDLLSLHTFRGIKILTVQAILSLMKTSPEFKMLEIEGES